jgi:hypothetical protein
LAIENNSPSLDQVKAILNGKKTLGPGQDIREVKNAYEAYELLEAHKILMNDLTIEAGTFRSGGVGIFEGENLLHMEPPASLVPDQINQLFEWALNADIHPMIKSCVFHYEIEFIHPFADSGEFIEFMLEAIRDSLNEISVTVQVDEQVGMILDAIGEEMISGKELMERVGLKHRPTFRNNYLLPAIEDGYIEMTIPDKPNSSKQKYRRSKM